MDTNDTPRLVGTLVTLRGVEERDVVRRASLGRRRDVSRGFGGDREHDEPMSEDEAAEQLQPRSGSGLHWVIADETDTFVGLVGLSQVDTAHRSARFGIGIYDPDRHGQGLGTQATRLVLRYAFTELDLHRVSLTVLADNLAAVTAYRNAGFEVEGRLRQTLWRDDRWEDDLVMAILAPDWREHDEGRSAS